jgi:hypothetical protein
MPKPFAVWSAQISPKLRADGIADRWQQRIQTGRCGGAS